MDIHRPENFKHKIRLQNIITFANKIIERYSVPVKMLKFGRTIKAIEEFDLNVGNIQLVDMMSYKNFLKEQYHSLFLFSDSGTAQEEPALLETPVVVPRDYTERPDSILYNCSRMVNVNNLDNDTYKKALDFVDDVIHGVQVMDISWLGDGSTSEMIIQCLKREL